MDKHIKLLDSPGVILSNTGDQASLILRNCVRLESLTDPLPPIEAILRRCNKSQVSPIVCEGIYICVLCVCVLCVCVCVCVCVFMFVVRSCLLCVHVYCVYGIHGIVNFGFKNPSAPGLGS